MSPQDDIQKRYLAKGTLPAFHPPRLVVVSRWPYSGRLGMCQNFFALLYKAPCPYINYTGWSRRRWGLHAVGNDPLPSPGKIAARRTNDRHMETYALARPIDPSSYKWTASPGIMTEPEQVPGGAHWAVWRVTVSLGRRIWTLGLMNWPQA